MIPDVLKSLNSAFAVSVAEYLARMSLHAYLPPASASVSYKRMGALNTVPLFVENHQAYAVIFENFIIIAFRGTEKNFDDILTDFDFKLTDIANDRSAKCHSGFLKAANQLVPLIQALISQCTEEPEAVYFTGHSMGGALAQLSAHLLGNEITPKKITYSFGAPRIGNKALGHVLQQSGPHYRVVNTADIVPNLPLRYMGFTHSGTHCYLNLRGEISMNPSWAYLIIDQCFDILIGILKGFSHGLPVRAYLRHRIGDYISRLGKREF